MPPYHVKEYKKRNTAVYIAGNNNIFFPAIVAFVSLLKENPSGYDCFLCFDGNDITKNMSKLLKKYNIQFLDAKQIEGYQDVEKLGEMIEGRWPIEVYLNWCLPEHFLAQGYEISLKLDYDVLCTGSLDGLLKYNSKNFFCSFLTTFVDPAIPADALDAVKERTGLSEARKFSINCGVALFNNKTCKEIEFRKTLFEVIRTLFEKCPKLRTLEQAAIALVISNYEHSFKKLEKKYHQRTIARTVSKNFNPDIRIIHYLTKYKPWLPFTEKDLEEIGISGGILIPFYRNVWLEFASTIEGFDKFCKEKPFSSMELIGLPNAAILEARKAILEAQKEAGAKRAPKLKPKDIIVQRRRELSNKIGEDFNWTVAYGPFKGLKMSKITWWSRPSRAAMFLGVYEQEILKTLMATPDEYDTFIDIGAADGYYAVGTLVSKKFSEVYCFEISKRGQEAILDNARLNNMENSIHIFGEASPTFYKKIPAKKLKKSVILIDIEGVEFDLINKGLFKKMGNSVVIVELHDWFFDDGNEKLAKLKQDATATHNITELTTANRDMSQFQELKKFNDTDRWLICSEGRKQLMTWLRFDPIEQN